MPERYAVIGNPIAHSLSPRIHAEFARQTGQPVAYEAVLAARGGFDACVAQLRAQGFRGANVTLPFKLEAWRYATRHSARAAEAQAVNTLTFEDGGAVFGDNTDGCGLVRDLEANLGYALVANRVLLLGAGGAARGVLQPLLEKKPVTVTIANRTPEKARALAAHFRRWGPCSGGGYEVLANRQFDLVINATAASLEDVLPPLPPSLYAPRSLAYDMMYAPEATPFMRHARENGAARACDGLGMLVEQAAESFFIWRGVRPETAPVIALMRDRALSPS